MTTANLLDFDLDGLAVFCERLGEKRFRATQLFRWIHQRGAGDFDAMSDLAKALRDKLKGCARVEALPVISEHVSSDGTVKWLFDVGDGNAVEAVFIPEDDRGTLCVSSQAGCAVGCRFCSTGHQGFSRNLTTGEIVAQLWFAEHSLRKRLQTEERVISNVVMMGMGEPLQNYSALVPALKVMLDDHGYGLSRRRVTVSTSGVVPMMDRLSQDCPVALAVSLHAPNDPLRDNLVPLNRKYPISELLDACNRYLEYAPRDFITFEYCMLDGVNDILEVFAEKVTITPKRNASSILIRGMKGSKTIPFPSITAIQFREANPINGYIQFSILGGLESKGGVIAAIGDENSCFFTDKNNALARQIKDYIETQIFAAKTPGQAAPANLSDELHKLAKLNADGVLTDDEFQSAKKRLIS